MNIKAMRQAAHLLQVDVAEKMGVTQATVAGWETGKFWPDSKKLPALAKTLNCKIDDLFADSDQ